jgi:glycosyltransferase involved in cell wall biosynthesis
VYMGSLLPQFDAGRVIDAARGVIMRDSSILFLFVGAGAGRVELERRVHSEGLGEHVRFLGYLSDLDMMRHLRAAHVLLFPIENTVLNASRSPNKTFLYMAARRPIVTNRVGNVADVLGTAALYFDFASVDDFVDKILDGLSPDAPIPGPDQLALHTYDVRYEDYLTILAGEHSIRTLAG